MAKDSDQYGKKEAQKRFEDALRGGFKTPAKPHSEMKMGKNKKATASRANRRPPVKSEP